MYFEDSYVKETKTGYTTQVQVYACLDCSNCSFVALCTPNTETKHIYINWNVRKLRGKARKLLYSEKSVKLRSQRRWDVEGVLGQIKYNQKFRRCMLRGLQKVYTELGIISIAHNFIKLAAC